MQVYLVGGAVRDAQLGIPHRERDWCVVGAAPAELEALPANMKAVAENISALPATQGDQASQPHGESHADSPAVSRGAQQELAPLPSGSAPWRGLLFLKDRGMSYSGSVTGGAVNS